VNGTGVDADGLGLFPRINVGLLASQNRRRPDTQQDRNE